MPDFLDMLPKGPAYFIKRGDAWVSDNARVSVQACKQRWVELPDGSYAPTFYAEGGRDAISRAENTTTKTYGDLVSVEQKGKTLNKFGRNRVVGTSFATIAELQGATLHAPYGATNAQNSVVCSNTGETQVWMYEGYSVDESGNLSFVVGEVTLTGRTRAALPTPVRDITRAYVKPSGDFENPSVAAVGDIYFYDNTDGDNGSGVPTTAANTSLVLLSGETQSEKAATSISAGDYWFITEFSSAIADATGPTNFAVVRMETRDVANGGAWRPLGRDYILWPDSVGITREFPEVAIVPKSHDWRAVGRVDGGACTLTAEARGYLAAVL